MPTNGVPSTSPRSIGRSTPSTASRAAATGSRGIPSTRARSLPRPQGMIATAISLSRSALATGRSRPSPPTAATVSPARAARAASSAACSELRVVTTRLGAPSRSSSAVTAGTAASALPPPDAGLTNSAKRRLIAR